MSELVTAMPLAVSERESALCAIAQVNALVAGFLGARFLAKSRASAMAFAVLGAFAAMVALILTDGQGAFLLLFLAGPIYFLAVAGRRHLR